jgi:hypothetical protein
MMKCRVIIGYIVGSIKQNLAVQIGILIFQNKVFGLDQRHITE